MTIIIIVRAADRTRPKTGPRYHEIRSVPFTPTGIVSHDREFCDNVAKLLGCGRYGVSDVLGWDTVEIID